MLNQIGLLKTAGDRQQGTGLIEILIVVIILSIMAVWAIPFYHSTFQNWEAKQTRSTLVMALNTAKTQSFTYRQHVVVCLADQNNLCHKDAMHQLLVFFDKDDNHAFNANQDTIIMQNRWKLRYGQVHLRVGARRHYTKFFGETGLPRGHMGHIKYCPTNLDSSTRYQVSFSMTGNIKYKPDAIHDTDCP